LFVILSKIGKILDCVERQGFIIQTATTYLTDLTHFVGLALPNTTRYNQFDWFV